MRYRTIVADPPWDHSDGTGASYSTRGRRDCALPYGHMTIEEIAALPVLELAEPGAHLYLWTTNRYLRAAFEIGEAWGFHHIATLAWCKQRGLGSGGVFYSNLEFCLHQRAPGGDIRTPARINSRWFDWPRNIHSAKPEAFLDLVEQVSPEPRLEMFARRARLGWHVWGNEVASHVEIPGFSESAARPVGHPPEWCPADAGNGLGSRVAPDGAQTGAANDDQYTNPATGEAYPRWTGADPQEMP